MCCLSGDTEKKVVETSMQCRAEWSGVPDCCGLMACISEAGILRWGQPHQRVVLGHASTPKELARTSPNLCTPLYSSSCERHY